MTFLLLVGLLGAAFFVFSIPARAQNIDVNQPEITDPLDLEQTVSNVINYSMGVLALIALIFILYGGFLWMTAGGDQEKVKKARKTVINACIGLLIVLSAWVIVRLIFGLFAGNNRERCGEGDTIEYCYPSCGTCGTLVGSRVCADGYWGACSVHCPAGGCGDPVVEEFKIRWKTPDDGDVNVPPCTLIQINFNHSLMTGVIPNEMFELRKCLNTNCSQFDSPVTGNLRVPEGENIQRRLLNFRPSADLALNTKYRAMVSGDLKDSGGKTLLGDDVWYFTTDDQTDNTSPQVIKTNPLDGKTDFRLLCLLQMEFNEVMDMATVAENSNLRMNPDSTTWGGWGGWKAENGAFASWTPKNGYTPTTDYTATGKSSTRYTSRNDWIAAEEPADDGMRDVCGNALAADKEWNFKTGIERECRPIIDSVTPLSGYHSDELLIKGFNFSSGGNVVFKSEIYTSPGTGGQKVCFNDCVAGGFCWPSESCFDVNGWTDEEIKVKIPAGDTGAVRGQIKVSTGDYNVWSQESIGVDSPHINRVGGLNGRPQGNVGQMVSISGINFRDDSRIYFIKDGLTMIEADAPPTACRRSSTQLIGIVPEDLEGAGFIKIQVVNGAQVVNGVALTLKQRSSNLKDFTKTTDEVGPGICAITDNLGGVCDDGNAGGMVGDERRVIGARFGNNASGDDQLTFNNIEALVAEAGWSDELLQTVVPSGVLVGTNIVQATVAGVGSNPFDFNVPCGKYSCDQYPETFVCEPFGACPNNMECDSTCACVDSLLVKKQWPDCQEACINTAIGVEFSEGIDLTTMIPANFKVQNCGADETCASPSDVDGDLSGDGIKINFDPDNNLSRATYFRVILSGFKTLGIAPELPRQLGKNFDSNGDNTPDAYSWIFKTKDSATACAATSMEVTPTTVTVTKLGSIGRFSARSQSAANCAGAPLSNRMLNYTWSLIPVTPVPPTVGEKGACVGAVCAVKAVGEGTANVKAELTAASIFGLATFMVNLTPENIHCIGCTADANCATYGSEFGCNPNDGCCSVAPKMIGIQPANNDVNVCLNVGIQGEFQEAIKRISDLKNNFKLYPVDVAGVLGVEVPTRFSLESGNNKIFHLLPTTCQLSANQKYLIAVKKGVSGSGIVSSRGVSFSDCGSLMSAQTIAGENWCVATFTTGNTQCAVSALGVDPPAKTVARGRELEYSAYGYDSLSKSVCVKDCAWNDTAGKVSFGAAPADNACLDQKLTANIAGTTIIKASVNAGAISCGTGSFVCGNLNITGGGIGEECSSNATMCVMDNDRCSPTDHCDTSCHCAAGPSPSAPEIDTVNGPRKCINGVVIVTFNTLVQKNTITTSTLHLEDSVGKVITDGFDLIQDIDTNGDGRADVTRVILSPVGGFPGGGTYAVFIHSDIQSIMGVPVYSIRAYPFNLDNDAYFCQLGGATWKAAAGNFRRRNETQNFVLIPTAANGEELSMNGLGTLGWKAILNQAINLVTMTTSSPDETHSYPRADISIAGINLNGKAQVVGILSDNPTEAAPSLVTAVLPIDVFICENPGEFIFISTDAEGNEVRTAVSEFKNFGDNNVSTRFCQDYGNANDTSDDLPNIIVRAGDPIGDTDFWNNSHWLMSAEPNFETGATLTGVLGTMSFQNQDYLDPTTWFKNKYGTTASGGNFEVGGYPALKEGRSIYVGATNVYCSASGARTAQIFPTENNNLWQSLAVWWQGQLGKLKGLLKVAYADVGSTCSLNTANGFCSDSGSCQRYIDTNMHLLSYSENSDAKMQNLYNQLVKNLSFNNNLTAPEVQKRMIYDLRRLYDLRSILARVEAYKASHGTYPQLPSGSYIVGQSTSVWPSWNTTLATALGGTLPIDPKNKLNWPARNEDNTCTPAPTDYEGYTNESEPGICFPSEYATATGWSESLRDFKCPPPDSHFYMYKVLDSGNDFGLYANMEYFDADDFHSPSLPASHIGLTDRPCTGSGCTLNFRLSHSAVDIPLSDCNGTANGICPAGCSANNDPDCVCSGSVDGVCIEPPCSRSNDYDCYLDYLAEDDDYLDIIVDVNVPTVSITNAPDVWTNIARRIGVGCSLPSGGTCSGQGFKDVGAGATACPYNFSEYASGATQEVSENKYFCATAKNANGLAGFTAVPTQIKVDQIAPPVAGKNFRVEGSDRTEMDENRKVTLCSSFKPVLRWDTLADLGGSGLKQIEIWRKKDNSWGTAPLATLTDTSVVEWREGDLEVGTYNYGIHVKDKADNCATESGPCGEDKSDNIVTVEIKDCSDKTLTVIRVGGTSRVTSHPPGMTCIPGGPCTGVFGYNVNSVTLTAVEENGDIFRGWTNCLAPYNSKVCTANLNSRDTIVTVNFQPTWTVTAVAKVGGVINNAAGSIDGAGTVLDRGNVTLTATANPGYIFDKWTPASDATCGCVDSNSDTCVLNGIGGNLGCVANFIEEKEFTVRNNKQGSVSANITLSTGSTDRLDCPATDADGVCSQSEFYDSQIMAVATPLVGYRFTGWSSEPNVCSGTGACSFAFTKDTVITANFEDAVAPKVTKFKFSGTTSRNICLEVGNAVPAVEYGYDELPAGGAVTVENWLDANNVWEEADRKYPNPTGGVYTPVLGGAGSYRLGIHVKDAAGNVVTEGGQHFGGVDSDIWDSGRTAFSNLAINMCGDDQICGSNGNCLTRKNVFVTRKKTITASSINNSGETNGDIKYGNSPRLTGIAAADAICNDLARQDNLPGTYVAWLSTVDINAKDRINVSGSIFYRAGQSVVIATAEGLINCTDSLHCLVNPIASSSYKVWTGTKTNGLKIEFDWERCDDWTSSFAGGVLKGKHGISNSIESAWTISGDTLKCDKPAHLYCFQQ